jgi:circadian clock protein KaiC
VPGTDPLQELDLARVPTGISGLDEITHGGLPENRLTLVAGTSGAGKTVLCAQYLAEGVRRGEAGVFVTFEERPDMTRRNMQSLGIPIEEWEAADKWRFVNASPRFDEPLVVAGLFDLASLILRVRTAVEETGAKRVAIDSVGALVTQFTEPRPARESLFQLGYHLESAGVTSVVTAERVEDYGPISRLGFEEFLADNVIVLRNGLEYEKRRRTIEVLKLRGGSHQRGEHLFTLARRTGIVVVPHEDVDFAYGTSTRRLSSGNPGLDAMLNGGLFDRSIALVTGPTGAGKSLVATQFVGAGAPNGERSLLISFEESRAQLGRNAHAWGLDFDAMEREGLLRILVAAPEAASLEDHLMRMKRTIDDFKPDRVAIDSLTALQRISTVKTFREYVLGLAFHIKNNALLGLLTAAGVDVLRDDLPGDLHLSTSSDAIIALNYVGFEGELHRGISVVKLRGSDHDKAIREYTISDTGMQIGEPFGRRLWADSPQFF